MKGNVTKWTQKTNLKNKISQIIGNVESGLYWKYTQRHRELQKRLDVQTPPLSQCLDLERRLANLSGGMNFSSRPTPIRMSCVGRKTFEENIVTGFYWMGRRRYLKLKVIIFFLWKILPLAFKTDIHKLR